MKYAQALTKLIDTQYAEAEKQQNYYSDTLGLDRDRFRETRDEIATGRTNIRLNAYVGRNLDGDAFWESDALEFGVFDCGREYGLTYTVADWTFCVYEHRNTDSLCIEGCPTDDMKPCGPYGGSDKYDVMFETGPEGEYRVYRALEAALLHVKDSPGATRDKLKKVMKRA